MTFFTYRCKETGQHWNGNIPEGGTLEIANGYFAISDSKRVILFSIKVDCVRPLLTTIPNNVSCSVCGINMREPGSHMCSDLACRAHYE